MGDHDGVLRRSRRKEVGDLVTGSSCGRELGDAICNGARAREILLRLAVASLASFPSTVTWMSSLDCCLSPGAVCLHTQARR